MSTGGDFDPILLEVMNNELGAVADEMAFSMRRAARSFAGREGGDFMVGLLDRQGDLTVRSQFALGTWYLPMVMPWVLRKYQGKFQKGDLVVTNDPYGGGSHLNDIVLLMPVFWEEELVAFSGSALHHPDVGGRAAGGFSPLSQEVFEEGLRLPAVLLYRAGVRNAPVFDVIEANTRAPDDLMGDLEGQVVACHRGEDGYFRLIRKYGLETVSAYGQHLMDYTERQLRAGIATLPEGKWAAEAQSEDDGIGGQGPKIVLQVAIQGGNITLDYNGTSPQARSAMNRPPGMTFVGDSEAVRRALELDVPVNSGIRVPMRVIAPEGTVVNPRFPAAVGARATLRSGTLSDILAYVMPERMPAAASGPPGIMVFTYRLEDGSPRVLFDLYQNGTGAQPQRDGIDGGGSNSGMGGLLATPTELIEREYPVVVEEFGFAPDTGGAGKFRGAVSVRRRWRYLKDGHVYVRNHFAISTPYGLSGGKNGTTSKITLESDGKFVKLPVKSDIEVDVHAGDVLTHTVAGTGGHGDPWERDPQRVLEDVLDEKITLPCAEQEYGVVISPDGMKIDQEKTAKVRKPGRPAGPDMPPPSLTVRSVL